MLGGSLRFEGSTPRQSILAYPSHLCVLCGSDTICDDSADQLSSYATDMYLVPEWSKVSVHLSMLWQIKKPSAAWHYNICKDYPGATKALTEVAQTLIMPSSCT